MNMKLAFTKKTSLRIFNRAPINFWEPEKVEEDSMTKNNFYQDSICHEVKYNPINKKSDTYKSISNLSLTVLLSNGSNSWRTSTSTFMEMALIKMVPRVST
jgi:hypothetical protein